MAERSVKISQNLIFDAKLRFAHLAALRTATFVKIRVIKNLITLPVGVKFIKAALIKSAFHQKMFSNFRFNESLKSQKARGLRRKAQF